MSLTLTFRGGAEGWIEVKYAHGICYVPYQAHVGSLLEKLIAGGHRVRPLPPRKGSGARRPGSGGGGSGT